MPKKNRRLEILRHDLSADKSLRAWSAADEYLLQAFNDLERKPERLAVYNDRFGFLTCHLTEFSPIVICTQKSQEKAVSANLSANSLPQSVFQSPLSPLASKMDMALMKIPKSLGLFELFLDHIARNSTDDVQVICGFMTRHFSPRLLDLAHEYFEGVEQSMAIKKSRLLTLTKKKNPTAKELISHIPYQNKVYHQYLGVFSNTHIDYATQFFLEHIEVRTTDQRILDLASGNGVIAKEISTIHRGAEIHLIDDAYLAVASAQLNIDGAHIHHHWNDDLSIFENESFDLIATNPPFHFEHEINIQVALTLFKDCHRCLKPGGNLQVVANRHLNYKTHLDRWFSSVQVLAENEKYMVYKCLKKP